MIKIRFAITLAALLGASVGLVACAGAVRDEGAFNALAVQAESEIREAEKAGFLWRDTEQLLADARKAHSEGQHDEATKLVQKSIKQAQLAQQQARDNANARPNYPSNP